LVNRKNQVVKAVPAGLTENYELVRFGPDIGPCFGGYDIDVVNDMKSFHNRAIPYTFKKVVGGVDLVPQDYTLLTDSSNWGVEDIEVFKVAVT